MRNSVLDLVKGDTCDLSNWSCPERFGNEVLRLRRKFWIGIICIEIILNLESWLGFKKQNLERKGEPWGMFRIEGDRKVRERFIREVKGSQQDGSLQKQREMRIS
jgi:hypothetical protein